MVKYLQLNDIGCYKRAFNISNYAWKIVILWEWFAKRAIGAQFATAIDSISANIAEGFGRFHKKDKIHFYRISFGSVMEALDWNQKAYVRGLLSKEQHEYILKELKVLPKEINLLVKFTRDKLQQ